MPHEQRPNEPHRQQQVQGVLVQIFGQEYKIGGDPDEVRQVAAYVDGKMREIAAAQRGRPSKDQVAVLAAMEITAELMRVVAERNTVTQKAHENIDRLSKLVEERAQLSGQRRQDATSLERRLHQRAQSVEDPSHA